MSGIKCEEKKSVVGYLCAGELQGFPFCFVFVVRCSSFRGKRMESLSLCLPLFAMLTYVLLTED